MDNPQENNSWNIDAESFEPKLTDESEPEGFFNQSEPDGRSGGAGPARPLKINDNAHLQYYLANVQNNAGLISYFNHMALSQQYDQQQYMYMQSLAGGMLSNGQFQNHPMTNLLSSGGKQVLAGPHLQNTYLNPFMPYNRITQPQMIAMPYLLQPSVPNMTNPAGRSRRNSCRTSKVFNTGDPEIDKHLTDSYKLINPRSDFNRDMSHSRFFVIKSYTEEHVHRSIKYGEWCSTQRGNDILDKAYRSVQAQGGHVYLFFSVNSSGYFCGVAQMTTECDSGRRSCHWNDDKWQGGFHVEWIYVKDVPNKYLKHIILEHNDNRPITNSRDATEIKPPQKGYETLRLIHEYHHNSSLFDDFEFYEGREREVQINAPSGTGQ